VKQASKDEVAKQSRGRKEKVLWLLLLLLASISFCLTSPCLAISCLLACMSFGVVVCLCGVSVWHERGGLFLLHSCLHNLFPFLFLARSFSFPFLVIAQKDGQTDTLYSLILFPVPPAERRQQQQQRQQQQPQALKRHSDALS
jgi:hypothetical protein